MAANLHKNRRDQLIYADYAAYWAAGKRDEIIWPLLEEKYHLAPSTIYRIILKVKSS